MSERSSEKPLPHSAESESTILGGIIRNNTLMPQAIEHLKLVDFYVPGNLYTFEAMLALFQKGSEITTPLIVEELRKSGKLDHAGGATRLAYLIEGLPPIYDLSPYIEIVKGKTFLRDLSKVAKQIWDMSNEDSDHPHEIGNQAERLIFDITQQRIKQGLVPASAITQSVIEHIQNIQGSGLNITGLTTGFRDLDKLLSGLQKSDLILIAGRPSMGKTALGLNIAENAAINHGAVVAFFSLEMSKEALILRMLCSQAKVDSQKFRNGTVSKEDWKKLAHALGQIDRSKLFIDDTPGINPLEILAKCRRLVAQEGRLDLIEADYLQLMSGAKTRYGSRQEEVSDISRNCKGVAKELNVPFAALSQLSRSPEARSGNRPQLADLRESGALEQDADVVALMYRHDYYHVKDEGYVPDHTAEVIIAKQRNGPTDTVKLTWMGQYTRFEDQADITTEPGSLWAPPESYAASDYEEPSIPSPAPEEPEGMFEGRESEGTLEAPETTTPPVQHPNDDMPF